MEVVFDGTEDREVSTSVVLILLVSIEVAEEEVWVM